MPCRPIFAPSSGVVDAGDAVVVQFLDFVRDDHAAAAAEYLDVLAAALAQQVDRVLEVFDVAALVGGDGDALHVFLDRRVDDFIDRAIVAEVDDFDAAGLQDAAHDVDRGIMAVEQAGRGDEADFVGGPVFLVGGLLAQVGHKLCSLCRGELLLSFPAQAGNPFRFIAKWLTRSCSGDEIWGLIRLPRGAYFRVTGAGAHSSSWPNITPPMSWGCTPADRIVTITMHANHEDNRGKRD